MRSVAQATKCNVDELAESIALVAASGWPGIEGCQAVEAVTTQHADGRKRSASSPGDGWAGEALAPKRFDLGFYRKVELARAAMRQCANLGLTPRRRMDV